MRNALTEPLEPEKSRPAHAPGLAARLVALGKACAALPRVDERPDDEIVGYDEAGLWR